jgi:hypothetical protein
MSIKTEVTQKDYQAFVKHVARMVSASSGSKIVRLFISIAFGLALALALSLLKVAARPTFFWALICGALFGGLVLMSFVAYVSRQQMQRMRPVDDWLIVGAHEVFLEEEGIRQRSRRHQSVYQWSLVRAVALTEQHMFVMVDRIAGIILPRRAFASEAEREQFLSEIERRSGQARAATALPWGRGAK